MRRLCLLLVAALPAASLLVAQEEPARVVRQLSFAGNSAVDDYTLASAISTTSSSWAATVPIIRWLGLGEKRFFDEQEFRRDVVRLLLLYRQSGFMNAVVDTVVRRQPRNVFITFRIHEGDPVRVAHVTIAGVDGIVDTAKLRRALPLQIGDPFNRFLLQASADSIVSRLKNSGYPYAEVLRNFDSEAGALRADVQLEALPGPHRRVGEVALHGLTDVDSGTVRRILPIRSGDPYRQDLLYRSQRELYGLGVFRSVNVVLVDSLPPAPADPSDSTVRVLVQLEEGPRHSIRMGAGYGSVDCFRVQTGWGAHDFLGGARALEVSARVSKVGGGSSADTKGFNQLCNPFFSNWTPDTLNYSFGVTLRQPAFIRPAHTAEVSLFTEKRSEFNAYTREAVGANLDVTINARRQIPVTLGYSYSVGRTQALPAVYCNLFRVCDSTSQGFLRERRPFGAVSMTVVRDRVNNVLDPSNGSLVTGTLLYASPLVGSQSPYEFNRAELEISRYHPIGRRFVFAWRVRAGSIFPQAISLGSQAVRYVPPDQRFYGGGPNSVRGYGRNELGPRVYIVTDTSAANIDPVATVRAGETVYKDVFTAPTGGNSVVVLNAELRLPSPILPQRMRLGLFVDVGQVWERGAEPVALRTVRVTPGAGVRITTPLGPVRVDLAYNGYPAEQGPLLYQSGATLTQITPRYPPAGARVRQQFVWQFAVGQAF